jgi:pimeloyl-ACP methyl ester carboxylesterase
VRKAQISAKLLLGRVVRSAPTGGLPLPEFRATDCTLFYLDEGSGRPIVFVHGFTVTSRFFERQRAFFAGRYRFIAPDLRSHGRSEKTASGNTLPIQTRDLHELFSALDLHGAVLVGWSNGAFNVWRYLHDYGSDRVAGIVVVDESPCPVKRDGWSLGYFELAGLIAGMEARQVDNEAFVRNVFLGRIFAEPPGEDDAEWMAAEILMMPPATAAAVGFDSMARDYRPLLAEVDVPALVCFGSRSIVPGDNGIYLAEAIPNARLVHFEKSGHAPFWEEPDRFNSEVAAFVDELPSRG